MNKFLSEPVDALDLRLTKAEALLDGNLVDDPWKVKRDDEGDHEGSVTTISDVREHEDEPLDFSDTQDDSHDERVTSSRDDVEDHSDAEEDDHPDKDVQFIRASSLKSFRNQLISRGHHNLPPQARVNILQKIHQLFFGGPKFSKWTFICFI